MAKKICPDCGYIMMRTWTSKDKTRIRIECPNCDLGIEIEPKEEYRWQEILKEARKQWIKVKVKEADKDYRIAKEISLIFEKDIKRIIRKRRGKAARELLRIICGVLEKEICWYHSFQHKLAKEEIDRLTAISSVILDACYKVQNEIEKVR